MRNPGTRLEREGLIKEGRGLGNAEIHFNCNLKLES